MLILLIICFIVSTTFTLFFFFSFCDSVEGQHYKEQTLRWIWECYELVVHDKMTSERKVIHWSKQTGGHLYWKWNIRSYRHSVNKWRISDGQNINWCQVKILNTATFFGSWLLCCLSGRLKSMDCFKITFKKDSQFVLGNSYQACAQ